MSQSTNLCGTVHTLPTSNDTDWGAALAAFLAAVPTKLGPSVLHFGSGTTPADTADNFLRPGFEAAAADTTEIYFRVPLAGKMSKLYVQATTAPGTSGQVITVRKEAADTALTATLAAAGTQAADTTHSFTVAAGDRIAVKVKGVAGISAGAVNLVVSMLYSADA